MKRRRRNNALVAITILSSLVAVTAMLTDPNLYGIAFAAVLAVAFVAYVNEEPPAP